MSRRHRQHAKQVRINRIERLETRQMLAADGLSCDDFQGDFAAELTRAARGFESLRGSEFDLRDFDRSRDSHRNRDTDRIRDAFRDRDADGDRLARRAWNQAHGLRRDGLRFHHDNRVGSGLSDFGPAATDWYLGHDATLNDSLTIPMVKNLPANDPFGLDLFGTDPLGTNLTPAEAEQVINDGLDFGSTLPERNLPKRTQGAITTSRITFVIFLPSPASSLSLDSTASRSTTSRSITNSQAQPRTALPAAAPTEAPVLSNLLIQDSQPNEQTDAEPTPATLTAIEPTEAVQLVSVRQHPDLVTTATSVIVSPEGLKTPTGESAILEFPFDAPRFDELPLNHFQEQTTSLQDSFAELGELLDAIALERLESTQRGKYSLVPVIPADKHVDFLGQAEPETGADGMILLLPGGPLAHSATQFAVQMFDSPDDSMISQWTIGVGFYRALEVVGDTRFADALIGSEISIAPVQDGGAQHGIAESFTWQPDSVPSSQQAAGVVFCCLGIQYLRKRRREREHDPILTPMDS